MFPIFCFQQVGHTTRSCQVLKAERMPDQLSDDDLAFWSYVVEEQRPKSVAEAMDNSDDDEEEEVELESDEGGEDEQVGEDMDIE